MIPNVSIFDIAADGGISLEDAVDFVLDAEPVDLGSLYGLTGNAFYSAASRRWYFANLSKMEADKGGKFGSSGPARTGSTAIDYGKVKLHFDGDTKPADLKKYFGGKVPNKRDLCALASSNGRGEVRVSDEGFLMLSSTSDGHHAERMVSNGKLHNESLEVNETGTGMGTKLLANQVEVASRLGLKQILTIAGKSDDPDPRKAMNGYYTWPRLGYDAPLSPRDHERVGGEDGGKKFKLTQSQIDKTKTVAELMRLPGGRALWKERGFEMPMAFDLTPGSASRRALEAYVQDKFGATTNALITERQRRWWFATRDGGKSNWRGKHGAFAKKGGKLAGSAEPKSALDLVKTDYSKVEVTGLEHAKKFFGKEVTKEQLCALGSADSEGKLKCHLWDDDDFGPYLGLSFDNGSVHADRRIFKDAGKIKIGNELYEREKTAQGKGDSARVLLNQAHTAAELGVRMIETYAAGAGNGVSGAIGDFNGYYTWPRLGYDGPIYIEDLEYRAKKRLSPEQRDAYVFPFPAAERVSDLMKTPEGRQFWRLHGIGNDMEFDPKPGSQSRQVLEEYVKARFSKDSPINNAQLDGVEYMRALGLPPELGEGVTLNFFTAAQRRWWFANIGAKQQKPRPAPDLASAVRAVHQSGDTRHPITAAQVPEDLKVDAENWVNRIGDKTLNTVKQYTGPAYRELNGQLKGCPQTADCLAPAQRREFDRVKAALADTEPLAAPVTTYRGMARKIGTAQPLIDKFKAAAEKGEAVEFHGFVSTSLDPKTASSFGQVVFEIRAKTGVYLEGVTSHKGELELLQNHGTRYRVKGVLEEVPFEQVGTTGRPGSRTVIQLEELDAPTENKLHTEKQRKWYWANLGKEKGPRDWRKGGKDGGGGKKGYTVHGEVSDSFLSKVDAAMGSIPANVRAYVEKHGGTVQVGDRVTIVKPELAGVTPRGWTPGSTWDMAEGFYDNGAKFAVVTEHLLDSSGGIRNNTRVEGVLRHEYGHAVDSAESLYAHSSTPEFRAAYEADAADIRAKGLQFLYSYMLQSGNAGPSEVFAENVGHLCGGGAGARWLFGYEDHFPRTLSHVKKLLASL